MGLFRFLGVRSSAAQGQSCKLNVPASEHAMEFHGSREYGMLACSARLSKRILLGTQVGELAGGVRLQSYGALQDAAL